MKFSNLMLFTGAAWTSYRLVKNRKEISQEVVETSDILDKIQDNLANNKNHGTTMVFSYLRDKNFNQNLSTILPLVSSQELIQVIVKVGFASCNDYRTTFNTITHLLCLGIR